MHLTGHYAVRESELISQRDKVINRLQKLVALLGELVAEQADERDIAHCAKVICANALFIDETHRQYTPATYVDNLTARLSK